MLQPGSRSSCASGFPLVRQSLPVVFGNCGNSAVATVQIGQLDKPCCVGTWELLHVEGAGRGRPSSGRQVGGKLPPTYDTEKTSGNPLILENDKATASTPWPVP